MDWAEQFEEFVERKTIRAMEAQIPGYRTVETYGDALGLRRLGNAWTLDKFDGPFFESNADIVALGRVH